MTKVHCPLQDRRSAHHAALEHSPADQVILFKFDPFVFVDMTNVTLFEFEFQLRSPEKATAMAR
jgi:hypothetical protein